LKEGQVMMLPQYVQNEEEKLKYKHWWSITFTKAM
jgi:hypothetical protein